MTPVQIWMMPPYFIVAEDTFESGNFVGGYGWSGGGSTIIPEAVEVASDDFESTTLSGGTGFNGSWS